MTHDIGRRGVLRRLGPGALVCMAACLPAPLQAQSPGSALLRPTGVTGLSSGSAETVSIVAVGDIMMGTAFPDSTYLDPRIVPGVDPAVLIGADLVDVLRSGDVVFGNLEGALFDEGGESKRCRNMDACYAFRSPEWYAELLAEMGFNAVSLANNHGGDFLDAGRDATVAALDARGIVHAGLAPPGAATATLELADGTLIGLAAFSPNKGTVSINDLDGMRSIVEALDRTHEVVIVSFHGGAEGADRIHVTREDEEFYGERRGNPYEFAHAAIDAGADVVLGHGPHVPRAIELYRDRLIAYSLGNFWTWKRFNLRGPNGLAPVLVLRVTRDGRAHSASVVSAVQRGLGSPRLDPSGGAARLIDELSRTDFPEAPVRIDSAGGLVLPAGPGSPDR